MPQPKSGLINLANKQGNRSDNDAPQDQCCFVIFMSFSGGLGDLNCCVWLVRWVSNRLGCLRGCRVMFYFLCASDFVNSCGSDAFLGINDI